uniref:uncharacterized protein LOC120342560 n=1 Tax=Styela clava TaxID=7725 RepID=UPI00193A4283|nr:uncharacterized protein LOC120342560 [Styela clava]
MKFYTYNFPRMNSESPESIIEDVTRDSMGQYWMGSHTNEPWFRSHPHFYMTDYSNFYNHLTTMRDGRKLFQILTRKPKINKEDISKFTALAVKQGVDPTTLMTFECGDLIPSDYL